MLLELEDGTQFLVPAGLLERRADGRYDLRLRLREYAAQTAQGSLADAGLEGIPSAAPASVGERDEAIIRLAEETLEVGKRTVERGRVRLHKTVAERVETVDVPLERTEVEVERVSVGRPVEQAEGVRYEGDVMVIPRYEEVLVVTKQLVLVEEVRVSTRRGEYRNPQQVTLRREELTLERPGEESSDR